MPPELEPDEIQDMEADSSTVSKDATDAVADPAAAEAEPAESSTATDETKADTMSIVRDVVGEKQEPAAAAPSAEGEENEGEQQTQTSEPSDDYSDVPFNQHPRFQQLIRERNDLRGPAEQYRQVKAFMDANALTAEEAANGITIMGLAKLNPVEAFKQVAPWFKNLAIAAGELLPDDLADRVKKGEITDTVAMEISRMRAGQRAQEVREAFAKERREREQYTTAAKALVDAAASWEQDRLLKDPNFAKKSPRIQEKIHFLHATGQRPTTPEGVRAQLKTVYEIVNREMGAVAATQTRQQQRKPALNPVRGGTVAGNAQPAAPKGQRKTIDLIRDTIAARSS